MKFKALVSVAAVAASMSIFTGCAKAPVADIDTAKKAIETAKTAQADQYATTTYQSADDTLKAALAEVEKQNAAMALSRNYSEASRLLKVASELGAKASTDAVSGKEAMKVEVESSVTATKSALQAARDLMKKAPKGKEGKEALLAMEAELSTVDASLVEADADVTAANYVGAKDKLTAAQGKIQQITDELNKAIEKTGGKK